MEGPKHVVHLLPYLQFGGTEQHVLTLVRALRDSGRCTGEVLAPPGPFAERLREADIPLTLFHPAQKNLWRSFWQCRRALRAMAPRVDLVHVHAAPDLLLFNASARTRRLPTLLTVHGFHGPGAGASYRFAARLGRKYAGAVICVSRAEQKRLLSAGLAPEKLHLVYNGVVDPAAVKGDAGASAAADVPPESKSSGGVRIAFAGRIEPVKGIDVLLRALATLKTDEPVHLDIFGSQEKELQALAGELGLADRVHFHGYCPDAAQRIAGCDIFCLPSRGDVGPLVCVEAMAQGKPIVSTLVGGIPEMVVDGVTGLLVPVDDAPALTQALQRLIADSQLRRSMGEAGRRRYEMLYTEEAMARQTYAIYVGLVQQLHHG